MSAPYTSSRSPPPLVHPRPSHISHPPPEPTTSPPPAASSGAQYSPSTTASSLTNRRSGDGGTRASFDMSRQSGEGYMRFSSPAPVPAAAGAASSNAGPYGSFSGASSPPPGTASQQYYPMSGGGAMPPQNVPYGQTPYTQQQAPQAPGYGGGFGSFGNAFGGGPGGGGGAFVNDATAQMGMQFGRSAVMAGQEYVEKNFTRYLPLPLVKTSFTVTNAYVLRKLRLILFPWRHKPWARRSARGSGDVGVGGGPQAAAGVGGDAWLPPRDDINAPDLYIPTMALVTYTLLSALASGLQSRFHPEVLGVSISKALGVVLLEFLAIKLGCYLLDVRSSGASGVELIGYGGYKFVGIIVTILASFLNLGTLFSGAVFLYTFCAQAFFLLRSLKYVLLPDSSSASAAVTTITHGQRSRRVQFLFLLAMVQAVFMGVLVRV